jgi:hypothetical protein
MKITITAIPIKKKMKKEEAILMRVFDTSIIRIKNQVLKRIIPKIKILKHFVLIASSFSCFAIFLLFFESSQSLVSVST